MAGWLAGLLALAGWLTCWPDVWPRVWLAGSGWTWLAVPGSSWARLAEAGGSDLLGGWRTYRLWAGLGMKLACLKFRANIDGIVFWCFSRFGMKPHALAKPFDLVCKFIYEGARPLGELKQ